MTYLTQTAAAESLIADGFKDTGNGFYSKRSFIEDWDGRRSCVAICEIQHNRVDPEYKSPDYYTIRFI